MDEKHQKTLKTLQDWLITVCILMVALLVGFIVLLFLSILAAAFVSTIPSDNSYLIEITGLSGLAVNGTATIMVPIPANAKGEPVISEETLTLREISGWQMAIRETPYGKMLAFTTTEEYAPDIFSPASEFETKEGPRLFVPILATPGNASVAEFTRASSGTYTTVVYLDGFVPSPEDAAPVGFDLRCRGGGGRKHLIIEDTWTTTVNTVVPGTESGFVPVLAEYYVTAGGIYT